MRKFALLFALCAAAFADKILTYEIPNMMCVSCYEVIVQTLNDIKGVKKFDVNLDAKTADIVVEDGFSEKTIVEALKREGYQAVLKASK